MEPGLLQREQTFMLYFLASPADFFFVRSSIESVHQQEVGKKTKGLHASLRDMSLEHQGNCFVGSEVSVAASSQ